MKGDPTPVEASLSSLFDANSVEILLLLTMTVVVVVLLATFQAKKPKPKPRLKPAPTSKPSRPRGAADIPGLSAFDRDVLGRLAWILKSPGNIHKIARDEDAFLRAARIALAEGIATLDELRTLARHLGFDANRVGTGGLSTLKLGQGLEISVADNAMNSGAGELTTNHPSALKVRLRSGQTSFKPGKAVDVIAKGRDGLYRFETTVQAHDGRKLLLDHTSDLERVQRRKHRRRELRLPVAVRQGGNTRQTRTVDISIGGAAVKNPQRKLGPGQRVRCDFSFSEKQPITMSATVVRTSRNGSIAHLRFEQVQDAARHRLFRSIMAAASK